MANTSFTPQQIEDFLQEFFDVVGARQYVGARYIPIFGRAGSDTVEWDDLAPYEPLTVVMHEGVSYVSRRYVPRGIVITDTAYWVETYRFNAQVEQYRQQVLTFQGQINDIREDYIPFPTLPKYGTDGQVLTTGGDGTISWEDPVVVTPEVAGPVIDEWLTDHPEATTTVQDASLGFEKMTAQGATELMMPYLCIVGHGSENDRRYINLNTSDGTLEIPSDTAIVSGRYSFIIGDDMTVDLTAVTSSAKKLYWNVNDNTFLVTNYNVARNYPNVLIATIRKYGSVTPVITANFPWSINGLPYGIVINDSIVADNALSASKLNNDALSLFTSGFYLIVGRGSSNVERYIDFDTTNYVMRIPNDTVICTAKSNYVFHEDTAIDLTGAASSAKKLYWNVETDQFELINYYVSRGYPRVLVGAIRMFTGGSSYAQKQPIISAPFPWSVDGKPYGLDLDAGIMVRRYVNAVQQDSIISINHRGWGTYPENTIIAYQQSYAQGFAYVETDIAYTSDDVPVLLHDATINRTARNADGSEIGGTINIADITYAQALQYDFGIYKGQEFAGTKIPTFEEFIRVCKYLKLHPYIEFKRGTEAQTNLVFDIIEAYGMEDRVTFIAFNASYLNFAVARNPNARIGLLCNTIGTTEIATAQSLIRNNLFIDSNDFSTTAVNACKTLGVPMEAWVVNTASDILALDPYISGVTSNTIVADDVYKDHYEA